MHRVCGDRINPRSNRLGSPMNRAGFLHVSVDPGVLRQITGDRTLIFVVKLRVVHMSLVAGEIKVRLLYLQLVDHLPSIWTKLFVCAFPVVGRVGRVGDGLAHLFDVRGGVGVLAAKDGRRVILAVEDPVAGGIDQVRVDPVACLVVINLAGDGIFERTDRALVHVPIEFALGDVGVSSQAAADSATRAKPKSTYGLHFLQRFIHHWFVRPISIDLPLPKVFAVTRRPASMAPSSHA